MTAPGPALRREAQRLLGAERGRAFVAALAANLWYDGLVLPAPLSVHFAEPDHRAPARDRLDQLAADARRLAATFELFSRYPFGGSDGLAWYYLHVQRPRLDGVQLQRLADELADIASAAQSASAQITRRRGRRRDPRRTLVLQSVVIAYRDAVGKAPNAGKKFQDLIAAALADRHLPVPEDLKSFIAAALQSGE